MLVFGVLLVLLAGALVYSALTIFAASHYCAAKMVKAE